MAQTITNREKKKSGRGTETPAFGTQRSPEALGRLFRSERKRRGMTLQDVHDVSGLSLRFLSEFERGKPNVSLVKVMQALQIMGLELMIFPRREVRSLMSTHHLNMKNAGVNS